MHAKFAIYVFIFHKYTFDFQIAWRRAYFMKVIPEMRRPLSNGYKCIYLFNTVRPTDEPTSSFLSIYQLAALWLVFVRIGNLVM